MLSCGNFVGGISDDDDVACAEYDADVNAKASTDDVTNSGADDDADEASIAAHFAVVIVVDVALVDVVAAPIAINVNIAHVVATYAASTVVALLLLLISMLL